MLNNMHYNKRETEKLQIPFSNECTHSAEPSPQG